MGLHDGFHRGGRAVCGRVGVLHFVRQELAAGLVYARFIAAHTGRTGLVALHAGDLDALYLVPACFLCSFDCGDRAFFRRRFVAGADIGNDFGRVKGGIDRNDRQLGAADELRRRIALQRGNNKTVIVARAEVGLDHILHFVERGFRARSLDVYRNDVGVFLRVGFRAGLDILPVFRRQRFQDHADIVLSVCGRAACVRTPIRTAAACKARAHGTRQQHCQHSLFVHSSPLFFRVPSSLKISYLRHRLFARNAPLSAVPLEFSEETQEGPDNRLMGKWNCKRYM